MTVFYRAFGLALGARTVRVTRFRNDTPVAAERDVSRMKRHRACNSIACSDERSRVVAEHLANDATEVPKRASYALAPIIAPLSWKSTHVDAT